ETESGRLRKSVLRLTSGAGWNRVACEVRLAENQVSGRVVGRAVCESARRETQHTIIAGVRNPQIALRIEHNAGPQGRTSRDEGERLCGRSGLALIRLAAIEIRLSNNEIDRQKAAALRKRLRITNDAIIARIDDIEISDCIDGDRDRRGQSSTETAPRALLRRGQLIALPNDQIGGRAVRESGRIFPRQDAVVGCISDIEDWRACGCVERDAFRRVQFPSLGEIRRKRGDLLLLQYRLPYGARWQRVKRHLSGGRNCNKKKCAKRRLEIHQIHFGRERSITP